MTSEYSQRLPTRDEDIDFVFEEESSPLSLKVPRLLENTHHLFEDCDHSNTQETMIKHHNFGSLIRPSPFHEDSTTESKLNGCTSFPQENNFSTSSFNTSKGNPQGLGVIIRRSVDRGKMSFVVCNYSPNHKTYPHGILKSGRKSKFNDKTLLEFQKTTRSMSHSYITRRRTDGVSLTRGETFLSNSDGSDAFYGNDSD